MTALKPIGELVAEWMNGPPVDAKLEAVLAYVARGWPVFPVGPRKVPLTPHGKDDASLDPAVIRAWWKRWRDALASIVTGAPSGIIALDIDVRLGGRGFDSLEEMGIDFHPETPTAHTPSGGCHLLFRHPGFEVRNSTGKIGRFLDVRGDGGSLILPPGPGRFWDPILDHGTPLAPMPDWMQIKETPRPAAAPRPVPRSTAKLERYGEKALDDAVARIAAAPAGAQRDTLNAEAYGIGQLAGAGLIPSALGLEALTWAARKMPSFDGRRPWREADLVKIVRDAFVDGLARPRGAA
jgi:putative DNA primase/helicase